QAVGRLQVRRDEGVGSRVRPSREAHRPVRLAPQVARERMLEEAVVLQLVERRRNDEQRGRLDAARRTCAGWLLATIIGTTRREDDDEPQDERSAHPLRYSTRAPEGRAARRCPW